MEAKLNLCHLPSTDDDDYDTFDDDELCQDTVLRYQILIFTRRIRRREKLFRYRHPTADGSNYLRCLVVQPCNSFSGAQAKVILASDWSIQIT